MSENTKSFRSHFRLAATLGLIAIVVPVVAGPLAGSVISAGKNPFAIQAEVRQRAMHDRVRVRAKNRAFVKAANNCIDLRAETGEDIDCPDVNDESTFLPFLSLPHAAAGAARPSSELADFSERERAILQQSVDTGHCSGGLIARGLYRICKRILQENTTPRGFINDRVYLEIDKALANPRDLRTRVDQMKNARGTLRYRRSSDRESDYRAR